MVLQCMECGKNKGFMSVNYAGFSVKAQNYHPFPERIQDLILPGDKSKDYLCVDCANKRQIECSVHGVITTDKFGFGLAPTCSQCKEEKNATLTQKNKDDLSANSVNKPAIIEVPSKQEEFIKTIESFYRPYRLADNELKKSALRTERKVAIQLILQDLMADEWIGKLKSMGTNSEGKAYIEIQLNNSNIEVKTWNNALSDISDNTLISQGTGLYEKIANLTKNSMVRFWGEFQKDSKDYIKESSLFENNAMTKPQFIMHFLDIAPY